MSGNLPQRLILLIAFILLTSLASSQISTSSGSSGNLIFENSTGDTIFNVTSSGGLNLESQEIRNFYSDSCSGSNEVVKRIYANGSYECQTVPEDAGAEGLSATLETNNTANQSIDLHDNILNFSDYVRIGSETDANNNSVAIGKGASAKGNKPGTEWMNETAVGAGAVANSGGATALGAQTSAGADSVVVGRNAETSATNGVALGVSSGASSNNAISIGKSALSNANGAIAIGSKSRAHNAWEATFGNLDGEELDVNVTGNLTVHGSNGVNMPNGISIGVGGGNGGANVDGFEPVAIGDGASATGAFLSVAIGDDATAESGTAVGASASATGSRSAAYGIKSSATGDNAVAIGYSATAPNDREATFGSFGLGSLANPLEMDVNVTGNLTVHQKIFGSPGENVTVGQDLKVEGDVYSVGADLAEVYSAEKDYSPGTVVKVSDGRKEVEATETRFDSAVGVVSTDPGQILNYREKGEMIALAGKVPVRVSEEVEKGDRVAAGRNGMAFSCDMEDATEALTPAASNAEIVESLKQMESNRECLSSSFGKALEDSQNGMVEVKLE